MPSQVEGISASDYDLLSRYWRAEPWGPWRDNVHAALIARTVRAPYMKKGSKNLLEDFMVVDPAERQAKSAQTAQSFMQFFKTIAKRRKRQ